MNKYWLFGVTAAIVAIADQLTKMYIRATLPVYAAIPVIDDFFHIVHAQNPGGAFSLFADVDASLRRPFFLLAAAFAVGFLVVMVRQLPATERLLTFALGGVLGGALGNLADRIWFGVVTDFLDFQWSGYHWPAFNVADSFISTGIVILLFSSFFGEEPAEQP